MYLPYQSISKKTDSSAYVPKELYEAQSQAISRLDKKIVAKWDEWVASELNISVEKLWEVFSSEQIDSIGLCIYNFENGKSFIIADETGIGKGRILSGICRWAIAHNKKILFFTEREHLFSDFWRDLGDTETLQMIKNPVVFHGSAQVYNPLGEKVLKGTQKSVKNIEEQGFEEDSNFVMTTYSQVSLIKHKKTKKDPLVDYCENAVLILDECHNAAGDSNTKKFLLDLFKHCKHIAFSSATYIKDESQLDLYEKSIDFDTPTLALMKKLLANDNELILRKIFTYELTRKLQFWRREHEPIEVGWNTVFCENELEISNYINKYSSIINGVFALVDMMSKEPELAHLNFANNWFALGSTVNRLSRNLLLLLKIDTLVKSVEHSIASNRKPVIVIDSTFASIIKKVIIHQDESSSQTDDEDDAEIEEGIYELNFEKVLHYLIDEIAGKAIKENEYKISNNITIAYKELLKESSLFCALEISPIDLIVNKLKKLNITCGEISGRSFKIDENNKVVKIIKTPKSQTVSAFNSGQLDAIIITRAGASGISLHAGANFKDQRQRDLYELEITTRPTYRLQFIGRVNRKNQVSKPIFNAIITKLPFEQRILNIEQQKLKTLQSHISGDDEKLSQENIHHFYTEYCNMCAFRYLKNNPKIAYQMGIGLKNKPDDFYFIDSILKRCIVLTVEQQNFLYDYLIYCTEVESKVRSCDNLPSKVSMNDIKTFWHDMDSSSGAEFKKIYSNLPNLSINQFKFNWVGIMRATCTYSTNSVYDLNLKKDLSTNIETDAGKHLEYFHRILQEHFLYGQFDKNYLEHTLKPRLKNIKIGKTISLKTFEGSVFGYINKVTWPDIPTPWKYDNLGLIEIVAINPHLDDRIYYAPEKYFLTVEEFLLLDNVQIHEIEIDWKKFNRPEKNFERVDHFWVGHPVYMEFLRQAYSIGAVKYYHVGGKNNMCIMLPPSIKRESLAKLKKPIYDTKKIMEGLIGNSIASLSSSWQSEEKVKAKLKLSPTTGGYNLFVASEAMRDKDFIDFPLRKKLTNFKGEIKGYSMFMVPYKEIRTILFMFEKRDVIWFINKER